MDIIAQLKAERDKVARQDLMEPGTQRSVLSGACYLHRKDKPNRNHWATCDGKKADHKLRPAIVKSDCMREL